MRNLLRFGILLATGVLASAAFAEAGNQLRHWAKNSSVAEVLNGEHELDMEHPEEAITHFQRAIARDSLNAVAYVGLGVAYRLQKRYDEALVQFRKAEELEPEYSTPHSQAAVLYLDQNKPDKAIGELKEAATLDPKNAGCHSNLGHVYAHLHQYDEAVTEYKKALELNPGDAAVQAELKAAEQARVPPPSSPPVIVVLEPAIERSGQTVEVHSESLTIRGVVTGEASVPLVTVNQTPATIRTKGAQTFEFRADPVHLSAGDNRFEVATALLGRAETKLDFLVHYSPAAASAPQAPPTTATQPLSKADILRLLENYVPSEQVTVLVKEYGVSFHAIPDDLKEIRAAGGKDDLVEAVVLAGSRAR